MPQDVEKRIFSQFTSRRSVVHSTKGIVACTQPLAARCGQIILEKGGNAADAAVAVAAAMNVTEPCSTGIGGDAFCLYYDAKIKKVLSMNGSGRSSSQATLERVRTILGLKEGDRPKIPLSHALAVTVPGAAAAWVDTVERLGSGKVTLSEILEPAIRLCEDGYPVSELCSYMWLQNEDLLRRQNPNGCDMLKNGRAPRPGELFKNPALARTFRLLAAHGKKGFYEGEVAEALAKVVTDAGGLMTTDDLKHHGDFGTQDTQAVSLDYDVYPDEPVRLWEHPPNGQGLVAMIALGVIRELQKSGKVKKFGPNDHNSPEYIHVLIEALRIGFADGAWWVADPDVESIPVHGLVSKEYLAERAQLFDDKKASPPLKHGSPAQRTSETVYFSVTDAEGNGCSFINSNYNGFGTCYMPAGYGFTLQCRGAGFDLIEGHPNAIAPRKRPYHTIIPPMLTDPRDDSLFAVYGVMGGGMQPQGHVQVLLNMIAFDMSPQEALNAPRVCLGASTDYEGEPDRTVYLEEGISESVANALRDMGHLVKIVTGLGRGLFGRGQVVRCRKQDGSLIYSAASDPRGDGHAVPML